MTEIKPGDKARIKKTGEVFTVDDINDNPNRVADDEIYASGWGVAHRARLIRSGEYVRTGWIATLTLNPRTEGITRELHAIGEAGPELINFRP